MSVQRAQAAKATDPKPFWGFSESGSTFRSATRVENDVTAFIRDFRHQISTQFLSPADIEMALRIRPEWVRSAFPAAQEWMRYSKPWEWCFAPTSTSAEETLKRCMPQAHDDPNAYRDWVERAERHTHSKCRFDGLNEKHIELFGQSVERPATPANCRVHR